MAKDDKDNKVPVFEGLAHNVPLGEMAIKVVKTDRNHQHEVRFTRRRNIVTYIMVCIYSIPLITY